MLLSLGKTHNLLALGSQEAIIESLTFLNTALIFCPNL